MKLHYKVSGNGEPLIILHGLFGMLDNWQTIANALEKDFAVYLIDQRNHGRSPHDPVHTYAAMANDLYAFFIQTGISSAHILGHSMGGKTAMQFALMHPNEVKKLIVVDIGMKRYAGGHNAIFDALLSVDLSQIHYRSDAEKILLERIPDFGVRQFLLKSLQRNPDGTYQWKFNLHGLKENYEPNILAEISAMHVFNGEVLFIKGENSDYLNPSDFTDIQLLFPNAKMQEIPGTGHWVHADQPEKLIACIKEFLKE
ncbi:MAG: alpha/beta fold hydrolase [Chitinophagales bacterium]